MKIPLKICMSVLLSSFLFLSLFFYSCKKDAAREDPGSEITTDRLDRIKAMGFNTNGVVKIAGGYVVEGDIFLPDKDLESMPQSPKLRIAKTEQYNTFKLITTGASRVITISVTNLPTVYTAAVDDAIARYNALGMRLSFIRVGSGGQIDIQNGALPAGVLGRSAGFPDGSGNPPSPIVLSASNIGNSPDQAYLATVIAHEIGHCIGFRHTDYFNRNYSCYYSSQPNEGGGDMGAVNIPGTPTAEDPNSWMLACIGNGVNRPFNANDMIALNYLYGANPPATITSAPSAKVVPASGGNLINIYAIGATNNVIHKWYSEAFGWSTWQDLGGNIAQVPVASAKDQNSIDLFTVGTDNKLYYRWWDRSVWNGNTGGWLPWSDFGGAFASQPATLSRDAQTVDVFAIGTDNNLYQKWSSTSQGWAAWRNFGGNLKYSPTAVSKDVGTIDVFATGQDNALYHKWWDINQAANEGWSAWENFGGSLTSAPAAIAKDRWTIDVFARGAANNLLHKWYNVNQGWSAWEDLGGTISTAPVLVSKNAQSMNVFAKGANNNLLHKSYTVSQGWSAWEDLGGYITSQPAAVSIDGQTIDVFAKGSSNNLVHRRLTSSAWLAWEIIY
ncbi:M57 family metalloprotease [Chitinophaga sp. HK235]|uniref:M57 family metalloprotease n=1 Tax=Chitinophaga sp. HK235 TaxID=2952571 RepID=UPI001BACF83E|nr:M57 family metalloprotease [Chitinophaga sp. HK235]